MTAHYQDDKLKDVLTKALSSHYKTGYDKGRLDALEALSLSFHFVNNSGVLSSEDKKGYKIALDTIDAALRILEQDNEERGI